MQNYMAIVEYDGTGYSGFQQQPGETRTVQGELLKAICKILNETVRIEYSGRTDAGVHSRGQTINFKTGKNLDFYRFRWSVNSLLPDDIALRNISNVDIGFNARRDAKMREYCYYVVNNSSQSVFLKRYSILISRKLDMRLMKKAAGIFIGKKDFKSFCRKSCTGRNTVREIYDFSVSRNNDNMITFKILANSFLYNMVRIIVVAVLEVGEGSRGIQSLENALISEDRSISKKMAPAKGLFLNRVIY